MTRCQPKALEFIQDEATAPTIERNRKGSVGYTIQQQGNDGAVTS